VQKQTADRGIDHSCHSAHGLGDAQQSPRQVRCQVLVGAQEPAVRRAGQDGGAQQHCDCQNSIILHEAQGYEAEHGAQ